MGRYKRITQLGWSMVILKKTTVLVVGAGALGNEVLKNLALLGVGNILVIDMDTIEDHNLTRSVLFRNKDIGKYKAVTAARSVKEIDPSINIKAFCGTIQDTFGLGVFRQVDVVFGCLDNIQARIDINRYCFQTGTLYIDSGLRGIDGDVQVFGPPFEACFDCSVTPEMRQEAWKRYSCLKLKTRDNEEATGPTAPTISSIMAGLQVQLGIKFLHQLDVPLNTRTSLFGNIDEFSQVKLSRHKECPTHSLYEPIPGDEIIALPENSSTLTLQKLLQLIKKDLGGDAVLELDYDLITHVECKEHEIRRDIFKRRGTLYVDEAECPSCKKEGKTGSALIMGEHFTNQLDGSEYYLDKTVSQIGAPLYHIFTAKGETEGSIAYKYYLIAGDEEYIFPNKMEQPGIQKGHLSEENATQQINSQNQIKKSIKKED